MRSNAEWVQIVLLNVVFVVIVLLVIWARRRQRGAAVRAGRGEEYDRNKARASAFVNLLAGAILVVVMLASWSSVPPGNEPVFALFLLVGLGGIFYGLYKWYRLRR